MSTKISSPSSPRSIAADDALSSDSKTKFTTCVGMFMSCTCSARNMESTEGAQKYVAMHGGGHEQGRGGGGMHGRVHEIHLQCQEHWGHGQIFVGMHRGSRVRNVRARDMHGHVHKIHLMCQKHWGGLGGVDTY